MAKPKSSVSSPRVSTVPRGFHGVLSSRMGLPAPNVFEVASGDGEPAVAQPRADGRRTAAPEVRSALRRRHRSGRAATRPFRHQGPQSGIDTERRTVGDQDLALGVVCEPLFAAEFRGDRLRSAGSPWLSG